MQPPSLLPSANSAGTLTVDDYLRTADGPPWHELIDGHLVQDPSPTTDHQQIAREMVWTLLSYLKVHPVGTLFFAPLDVYLGASNVLQPDIAVVMNDRAGLISPRGIEGPPDLVIEILSPGTHEIDRGPKLRIYARAGVREAWLVDPTERTIEVHPFECGISSSVRLFRSGKTITTPLFPAWAGVAFGPGPTNVLGQPPPR